MGGDVVGWRCGVRKEVDGDVGRDEPRDHVITNFPIHEIKFRKYTKETDS